MLKYLFLALLILPLASCNEKEQGPYTEALSIQILDGTTHDFKVELAVTPQELMTGLMNRETMPGNAGMLFYFGNMAERGFWMKNTLIPLDLLFIKLDGTIHHIHENAIPHDLTSIKSNGAAAAVLEINGGLSQKLNIQAGDKVKHSFFNAN